MKVPMPEARRRVLVTGATGFIGSACLDPLLKAGYQVTGTYRSNTPPAPVPGVTWARADLTKPAEISALMDHHRPTHLLALAWHMGPGNQQAPDNFRWLQHSIDLLFAFAKAGGRRMVFCGSCAEYDWTGAAPLHETSTALRPATEYGAAKAALFMAYGSLAARLGLSGAWARPFFLYGPGEDPRRLAADVIISLLEGHEARCTHGRQQRDFLHVADAGRALAALLDSTLEGPVNIASGTAIPLGDLVHEAGRQIGASDLVRLGARAARPDDPPLVAADVSRLTKELGWRPRFNLETGLADTIDWWRNHLQKANAI